MPPSSTPSTGTADASSPKELAGHHRRDAVAVTLLALLVRLAVVAWAAVSHFPPAADGTYYQRIAERIGQGLGYTWLWPDGAVTYAAHYPVGYPAIVGATYALIDRYPFLGRVLGPPPVAAMLVNAFFGALAALAAHRLAARAAGPRLALAAGLLVAVHPGLVAYTPALMTEGVTASLVISAAAIAAWARERGTLSAAAVLGLVVGVATLVRPQSILLAPLFAILAGASVQSARRRLSLVVVATVAALGVCAPWTARNCVRMKHCALVSVNGGWNLLIGADPVSTGAWSPVKVPAACLSVFDEAQKDVCFGQEARRYIAEHPVTWLRLIPKKLAATFDFAGGGYYLRASNPVAFPYRNQVALGVVETLFERIVLLLTLVWAGGALPEGEKGWRRRARLAIAAVGVIFSLMLHAWIAYLALVLSAGLRGRSLVRGPLLPSTTVIVVGATLGTHAIFFGAGRYSMIVFPLITALAPLGFAGFASGARSAWSRVRTSRSSQATGPAPGLRLPPA